MEYEKYEKKQCFLIPMVLIAGNADRLRRMGVQDTDHI